MINLLFNIACNLITVIYIWLVKIPFIIALNTIFLITRYVFSFIGLNIKVAMTRFIL